MSDLSGSLCKIIFGHGKYLDSGTIKSLEWFSWRKWKKHNLVIDNWTYPGNGGMDGYFAISILCIRECFVVVQLDS